MIPGGWLSMHGSRWTSLNGRLSMDDSRWATRYGYFEYQVIIPVGLSIAPAGFQGYVNKFLTKKLDVFDIVCSWPKPRQSSQMGPRGPKETRPLPIWKSVDSSEWDLILRLRRVHQGVSGTWIGVTGMINIKGAAGLAKRAINRIVIVITNCYRTAGGQGPLFIYRDICPWAGYTDALQTAHVTKIVSCKQPTDAFGESDAQPLGQADVRPLTSWCTALWQPAK